MTAPIITAVSLTGLRRNQCHPNPGTVTGTGIQSGFPVRITNDHRGKVWVGTIGARAERDTWNFTALNKVDTDPVDKPGQDDLDVRSLERITVTVTNNSSETSNEVKVENVPVVP